METKDKILDLADKFIRTKGYNAFSYKDIASELGVKNAAIHYHFPSKADLGKEVIRRTRLRFTQKTKLWSTLTLREQISKFVDIYRKFHESREVCIVGALSPAYNTLPDVMKLEISNTYKELKIWLRNILAQGKMSGEFSFAKEPYYMADEVISKLISALLLERVAEEEIFLSISAKVLEEL